MDDLHFKAQILQAISDTYNCTYLFEEALVNSQTVYEYSLLIKDTLYANATLYRIAQLYNNLREYDKADSLFNIIAYSDKVHPKTKAAILEAYATMTTLHSDDYEKALSLFEESLSIGNGFSSYNTWGAYAYCLSRSGQKDRSEKIIGKLENAGMKDQYVYLAWKSKIERDKGNLLYASDLLEESTEKQTEGVLLLLRQSVVKAQRDYFSLQNKALQKENRLRRWLNLSFSLLIILIASLVLLLFALS